MEKMTIRRKLLMTVTVPLPQGGYPVHIQPGALRQTEESSNSAIAVLTNADAY